MKGLILLRGGGDLASGVALRLHHAGLQVLITELPQPLAVRRLVSFSEAVYMGQTTVEDVTARLVEPGQIETALEANEIPVLIDPQAEILRTTEVWAVVDARLLKSRPAPLPIPVRMRIGLGPGFRAGEDCEAVIETRRGHMLGRVYWQGSASPDSGQPDGDPRRVLRAGQDGRLVTHKEIGEHCEAGELIAEVVSGETKLAIRSPFKGVLRGLLRNGMEVRRGLKLGDVDGRDDPALCRLVSDKALAIGGGVLEVLIKNGRR